MAGFRPDGNRIGREVLDAGSSCKTCAADLTFLRTDVRPDYETCELPIRVVDLFAGGGGLTLGAAEAARRVGRGTYVALAVENAEATADVYMRNFPNANMIRADVSHVFDGAIGDRMTTAERKVARTVGSVDLILAGPPCQGHSDLNNHTRRKDPRNTLYLSAVRAAEVLRPRFVLVENVPAVLRDDTGVVEKATKALSAAGYSVADEVLDLVRFGVPQRRRRHILLAVFDGSVDPADLLEVQSSCNGHDARTVRWAISDLVDIAPWAGLDTPTQPTDVNLARMNWLVDNDEYDLPNELRPPCHHDSHKYNSMYGRLRWDSPAQTITTGYGSMGQGRFVHPARARTITPHEAARLQTLPDFFDLDETKHRSAWATIIGNAVPPLLGVHLVEPLLCSLATVDGMNTGTSAVVDHVAMPGANSASRLQRNGVPAASSETIRVRMINTKRRDTKPELRIRSVLHSMGFRYFVDRPIVGTRRRADIVFPADHTIVYIDGCFWHGCPEHGTLPKQNRQWWAAKLEANRKRDVDTDVMLKADGWTVLRFWEHEDSLVAASRVREVLLERRATTRRGRP